MGSINLREHERWVWLANIHTPLLLKKTTQKNKNKSKSTSLASQLARASYNTG